MYLNDFIKWYKRTDLCLSCVVSRPQTTLTRETKSPAECMCVALFPASNLGLAVYHPVIQNVLNCLTQAKKIDAGCRLFSGLLQITLLNLE